jgi:hypothetical protein
MLAARALNVITVFGHSVLCYVQRAVKYVQRSMLQSICMDHMRAESNCSLGAYGAEQHMQHVSFRVHIRPVQS